MRQNIFNEDFCEFIQALNEQEVNYILVGGYSVVLHGYNRTTGDMDIWVEPAIDNYNKLRKAFNQFGMPVFDMTAEKFLNTKEYDVFTFGRPPIAVDIMTKIKGLEFLDALKKAKWFELKKSLKVRTLALNDLIRAKKASGRLKDLNDLEHLA